MKTDEMQHKSKINNEKPEKHGKSMRIKHESRKLYDKTTDKQGEARNRKEKQWQAQNDINSSKTSADSVLEKQGKARTTNEKQGSKDNTLHIFFFGVAKDPFIRFPGVDLEEDDWRHS